MLPDPGTTLSEVPENPIAAGQATVDQLQQDTLARALNLAIQTGEYRLIWTQGLTPAMETMLTEAGYRWELVPEQAGDRVLLISPIPQN